jgi:hypothetical protein
MRQVATHRTAILFAAIALALFAVGSWRAEARSKQRVTVEERIYHYATVTPELLCQKLQRGKWLRLAIAQQADGSGNAWVIKCAY